VLEPKPYRREEGWGIEWVVVVVMMMMGVVVRRRGGEKRELGRRGCGGMSVVLREE